MLQEGTDTALDDQVARPRAPKAAEIPFSFGGLLASPFRGIGGGVSKTLAFNAEVAGAFGQVWGGYGGDSAGGMFSTQSDAERKQAEAARQKILKEGIDYSNEAGDVFRARAADILPDPKTAHASAQVVAGLADYATRAVGYSITLGPMAAPVFGTDVGFEEADRLKQQGVDLGTRTKAGVVAGAINAAAMAVPMHGATAPIRFGKGVAAGESAMVGQSLAEREILRAAGYDKIAESFDPLDPVALALGIVPGAIGARYGAPKQVGKLRTEADVRKAAQLTPAEQARSDAYERSPTNLAELERAIKAEKRPDVRALLETELAKQQRAAAEHGVALAVEAEPDLAPAARVGQVVDALEASRLTPDDMLVGREAHLSAVEMAADQMARGERVEVAPRLQPIDAPPVEFTTAKGSTYAIHEDGTTSRNKAARNDPGHEGDFGQKDRTVRTVYVDTDAAALTAAGIDNLGARGPRVAIKDGKATLVTWNEQQGRWGAAPSARGIPVHDQPAVGRYPLELWKATDDVPGHEAYSKMHAGNEITEMRTRVERAAAAFDQLRAARTPPEPKAPRDPAAAKEPAPKAGKAPKQEPAAKAPSEPQAAKAGDGEGKAPAAIERAAADLQALDPDMPVLLEGMDAPMKVGELMAKVKEEARQDTLAGKLLEVAAACDLSS